MDIPFADTLLSAWVRISARQRPVAPIETLDLDNVDRVLLILTTGLGDAILSTPIFSAVRQALPHARVALFVRAQWAPLFAGETDIDEVIEYRGKWRSFFRTLMRLRRFRPTLTMVLHGNDPDILPLAYLSGSRHIVRIPTSGTRHGQLLSNAGRETDRNTLPTWHYIDNRLRILDTVGIPVSRRTPVIRLTETATATAATWHQHHLGGKRYVVVHPWAADTYKTWPTTQASQFLTMAQARWPDLGFVITGGRADQAAAIALAANHHNVVVAAGTLDLPVTAALIAEANAVIAPDTGILHLATALDTPVIGLYSPTNPALVGPRAAHAPVIALTKPLTCDPCMEKRCPYKPATCMGQFQAADVLSALAPSLEGSA